MTVRSHGIRGWNLQRDAEGHRTYTVKFLLQSDDVGDGPANIVQTPGLPLPGAVWAFTHPSTGKLEVDIYAWCRWDTKVTPILTDEPNVYWEVEYLFSTRPPGSRGSGHSGGGGGLPGRGGGSGSPGGGSTDSCRTQQAQDPLLEPQKISGGYIKYQEEATLDINGNPILTSARERISGQLVMFDANLSQVRIEQNVPSLQLALVDGLMNCVNLNTLWGMPNRCVKLSNFNWEKKFYGTCYVYYTRTFDFEINQNTFDRSVLDEGTIVLRGKWDTSPSSATFGRYILGTGVAVGSTNPGDYQRYQDFNGNITRVLLDGQGQPAIHNLGYTGTGITSSPGKVLVRKYREVDFTTLGIPLTL